MVFETREQFRMLYLDRKNGLIADEMQGRGTVDHTPVYAREVVKRALEVAARPRSSWSGSIGAREGADHNVRSKILVFDLPRPAVSD